MALERHPLADQVLVILKRAWPGEVEKEDLIEQSGLSPTDLRDVLDDLRRAQELDEKGDNFAWLNPEDPDRTGVVTPAPGEDEQPDDEANLADRMQLPDHTGRHVQVAFHVEGSFAPSRGQSDDGLTAKAAKIAEEIGNILGTALPALGANVTVSKVQVYDSPRVVFDVEAPAEEAHEPD
jgi:hypothetical protein